MLPKIGCVVAFVSIFLACGCSDDQSISLSPLVARLGSIDCDEKESVEAEFTLRNNSPEPLSIEKTVVGCACSELLVDRNEISPRSSVNIKMRIRTKGLRGERKMISQVYTDNEAFPVFQLTAVGVFNSRAVPETIVRGIGDVFSGQHISGAIALNSAGLPEIDRFELADSDAHDFSMVPESSKGEVFGRFTGTTQSQYGPFDIRLTIKFKGEIPDSTLVLRGNCKSRLSYSPFVVLERV